MANTDNHSMGRCSYDVVDVVANDTDPDGDLPLVLISVQGAGGVGAVISGTRNIELTSGASTGLKTVNYTIRDTRGATASGQLKVTITAGNGCAAPPPMPLDQPPPFDEPVESSGTPAPPEATIDEPVPTPADPAPSEQPGMNEPVEWPEAPAEPVEPDPPEDPPEA